LGKMEIHPLSEKADKRTKSPELEGIQLVRNELTSEDHVFMKNLNFLSLDQISAFKETGCLIIPASQIWTPEELKILISEVDSMNSWEDAPGKYMKYYEPNPLFEVDNPSEPKKILQRIENFLQYSTGLNNILNGEKMIAATSQLFGEPSILYKEKIKILNLVVLQGLLLIKTMLPAGGCMAKIYTFQLWSQSTAQLKKMDALKLFMASIRKVFSVLLLRKCQRNS